MKNNFLKQSGITTDNKPVIIGIYKTFETYGLPLDIIFSIMIKKGWVPDWIALYQDCRSAGIDHERTLARIEEAINDSYGKEWSEVVISRLDDLFKNEAI